MNFTAVYNNKNSERKCNCYGPSIDQECYVAKLSLHTDREKDGYCLFDNNACYTNHPIKLSFNFPENPKIELDLYFNRKEAIEIASALLAFSQHPNFSQRSVKWSPPEHLPVLEHNLWSRKIKITYANFYEEDGSFYIEVEMENKTKYHLGRARFDILISFKEGDGQREIQFDKELLLDMLAKSKKTFTIDVSKNFTDMFIDETPDVQMEALKVYGLELNNE